MAQDQWTLQEKEQKSKPAHGPPLQARVVAANRTVLTTSVTIPAHMVMNGVQIKTEPGRKLMRAVGMAWQRWLQANKAGRTRPLQANKAGGRSDRHIP